MDFGDEMAERLVDIGKRFTALLGRSTWRATKKVTSTAWERLHASNASAAKEMSAVMDEAGELMASDYFQDGKVYAIGTGATLTRSGGMVKITYDFTDNRLPDGSAIEDFAGTEKDIKAQLKQAGAPSFDFEIVEGEGRLWYDYREQAAMSSALKETDLAFASIMDGAREKLVEPVSVEDLAEEHLMNRGEARTLSELSEDELKELFGNPDFAAEAARRADAIRCDYKACGVDVQARYVPRERQIVVECPEKFKPAFEAARERMEQAREKGEEAAKVAERRKDARTRNSGREPFEERAARVEGRQNERARQLERIERESRAAEKGVKQPQPKPPVRKGGAR